MTATAETVARAADDLGRIDTPEGMLSYITDALSVNANNLRRAARAVAEYDRRGYDPEALEERVSAQTLAMLRRIAAGQLDADLVVCVGMGRLLDKLGTLPLSEQRRIASGGEIRVATLDNSGTRTHRVARPLVQMEEIPWQQVLGDGHLRTPDAQWAWIDARAAKPARKAPDLIDEGKVDRERDGVQFGKRFISSATLKKWLKALGKL